jgi:hypothetical protein
MTTVFDRRRLPILARGALVACILAGTACGSDGTLGPGGHVIVSKTDAYSIVVLAPLAGDKSGTAADMNESGVVVGRSIANDGSARPVKWVGGQPTALADPGNASGSAVSVNADGTIVGTLDSTAVVWTNGSIDTVMYNGSPQWINNSTEPPTRINDRGQILFPLWLHETLPHYGFMIYDLPSNAWTLVPLPNPPPGIVDFNNKGQAIGVYFLLPTGGGHGPQRDTMEYGGVSLPPSSIGGLQWNPLDLTDSSDVLIGDGGSVLFGTAASSVALNRFFGGPGAARANNNDVVVGTGPDSTLYLWRKSANVTELVDAGKGWKFDHVLKLNDTGAILAHGQSSATGQSGSVMLTPISHN